MTHILTLSQIRDALKGHNINDVSAGSGLSYNTIYTVATGRQTNPTLGTMEKISKYLEARG
jgi:DNA-binding Xre family transcriptional regulator